MNVHQALTLKNRLVGEVKRLQEILNRENSREVNSLSQIDCDLVYNQLNETINRLITVKTAISKANINIYEKIAQIEEKKNQISFITNLRKIEGEVTDYNDNTKNYVCYINNAKSDDIISQLQSEINNLVDEVYAYNSKTEVEL